MLGEIDVAAGRGYPVNASAIALDIADGVARTVGEIWTVADWLKRGRTERCLALAPGWPIQRGGVAKADKPHGRGPHVTAHPHKDRTASPWSRFISNIEPLARRA